MLIAFAAASTAAAITPELARLEFWIAGVLGGAATIVDIRSRTIPNWLSLVTLLSGVAVQIWFGGWRGLGSALVGSAAGFAVFLAFYLLGGMGGGDVKLMAGFGALLGVSRLLLAAFWTAIVGGVIAAVVLGLAWLRNRSRQESADSVVRKQSIPYAPAIAVGVWLALLSAN